MTDEQRTLLAEYVHNLERLELSIETDMEFFDENYGTIQAVRRIIEDPEELMKVLATSDGFPGLLSRLLRLPLQIICHRQGLKTLERMRAGEETSAAEN